MRGTKGGKSQSIGPEKHPNNEEPRPLRRLEETHYLHFWDEAREFIGLSVCEGLQNIAEVKNITIIAYIEDCRLLC